MMKKTLLAVCLTAMSSVLLAQNMTNTYFIGDSLSDTGQLGSRFTTNPGNVWAHYLAQHLGANATPSSQGGTNFAVGGARVAVDTLADPSQPMGPTNPLLPAMTTQLDQLLALQNGRLDPNALYSVWGGPNDLFAVVANPLQGPNIIASSIQNQAAIINRLHAQGAGYILLADIPNLGQTPEFSEMPLMQALASQLSASYNQGLAAELAQSQANIIPLNVSGLLSELMTNPSAYGFANVTDAACTVSSLACGPEQLVAPDAAQTHLYADGVHPTSKGHKIIADYAESIVSAGAAVGLVAMTANQAGLSQMQRIDRRLATRAGVADDGVQVWAEGAAVFASGGHRQTKVDGANGSGSLGVSRQFNQWTLGTYLHYDQLDTRLQSKHALQQKRLGGGLYGRWADSNTWVNAQLYYANLDTKIQRNITLGVAQQRHHAKASGHQLGGRLMAGYDLQHGALTHGPLVGISLQKAKVKALNEAAAGGSSAMRFDAQSQNSVQSSLGYQLSLAVNPNWSVYASGQWLHEFKKPNEQLGASLQTGDYTQRHFKLSTKAKLAKNTGIFELGAVGRLTKQWDLNAGLSLQTANSVNAQNTVYVGTAYRF